MAGLFDKLQGKLEDRQTEGGITPIDLLELPPNMRKIMRLLLRRLKMGGQEIKEALPDLPDLEEALHELSQQGWLIELGEGEKKNYKVNLRRKKGSKLGQGIWGSLDNKISGSRKSEEKPAEGSETDHSESE